MFEKISKCPYCSGNLKVGPEDVFVVCGYCGREMEVPRFTQEEKRLTQAVEEMRASTEAAEATLQEAMKRAEESDAQMEERIAGLAEMIAIDSVNARMHRDAMLSELRADAMAQREEARAHLQELKSEQSRMVDRLGSLQVQQQASKAASLQHCYELGEAAQRAGRFDEAIGHFQKLLVMSEDHEAEVHWRIVMCRYGVEYVHEQSSDTWLPTIMHMIVDSVLEDADYQAAERFARSGQMRDYYHREATRIDNILDKYRQIYGSEKPYDIFISVKQGDEHGKPTKDSITGTRLYDMLTDMGLHVFNSRFSLQQRAGLEYEPYIMAALMHSRIMVVVGTRGDYMSAPWVRNEWRRYRWLQENDKKHSRRLIAYIVGMETSEIPKELGLLQVISTLESENPMGQLRGIAETEFTDRMAKPKTAAAAVNPQETAWLKRAEVYMNHGNFEQCDLFCEKVLDLNPESGMAYMYKLCAARGVKQLDELAKQPNPLDDDENYSLAMTFGSDVVINRLTRINNEIRDRVRKAREASERESMREKMEREIREQMQREFREQMEKEKAERDAAERVVREQAEQERAAREAAERAAREAREKLERERAGWEQAEREAAERAVREARERMAREAAERAVREQAERERAARETVKKEWTENKVVERMLREKIVVKLGEYLAARRRAEAAGISSVLGNFTVGETIVVRVTGLTAAAAQVELDDGSRGTVDVDRCSVKRVLHPADALTAGDMVSAKVLGMSADGKYILSIREADRSPLVFARGMSRWALPREQSENTAAQEPLKSVSARIGDIVTAKVTGMSSISAEVKLDNGQIGSIHASHCAATNVSRPSAVLKVGDVVRAKVMSENRTTGKLVLSIREAMSEGEKQASLNRQQAERDRTNATLSQNKVYEGMRNDPARAEELFKEGLEYSRKGSYSMAVARLKMAAELGHGLAMYNLGLICEGKYTGFLNYEEAYKWYLKGAEAGEVVAAESVAKMYENGTGVQKNLAEAARWYKVGADAGREVTKKALQRVETAMIREKGTDQVQFLYDQGMRSYDGGNYQAAAKTFVIAAGHGHARAAYQLSRMYSRGEGVAKDAKEADKWLLKAGELGDTDACYDLACRYHFGSGADKNMPEAVKWYRKGAEQGDPEAMFSLGMRYYNGEVVSKDLSEAAKWFGRASEKGHKEAGDMLDRVSKLNRISGIENELMDDDPEALFRQADRHLKQREHDKALPLLRRAAEKGHAMALYNLGVAYLEGSGVAKNAREAISCFEQAGEKGVANAWYNLGTIWDKGDGVDKDFYKARTCYMKAVDLGSAAAMNNIATMYLFGRGVNKDQNAALMWYDRAAAAGNEKAKENAARLRGTMGSAAAQPAPGEDPETLFRKAEEHYGKKEYEEALKLYRRAADMGHIQARCNMGVCYRNGYGVIQNYEEALRCFNKAAEAGNREGIFYLGSSYKNGLGVNEDFDKAFTYYLRAAEMGHALAMSNLSLMYANGEGCRKDLSKAAEWSQKASEAGCNSAKAYFERTGILRGVRPSVSRENAEDLYNQGRELQNKGEYGEALKLFRRAADLGYANAMNQVGYMYDIGKGAAQDYVKAAEYYRKAADKGHVVAMYNLAAKYKNGQGVAQDYAEAAKWYKKAADNGDADAMNMIGYYYDSGIGIAQDYVKAVEYYRKGAEKGQVTAMYNLAVKYKNGQGVAKDLDEAAKWYKKAADNGDADAMNMIGYYYDSGIGVAQDYVKAVEYYRKGAEKGQVTAMYNLAVKYKNGQGVAQDYAEAAKWYKKAADNGDADAMNMIGVYYHEGTGIGQDYVKAREYYQKAIDKGNVSAMSNLGLLYEDGLGVAKDLAEAAKWFRMAADKGHKSAPESLERVNKALAAQSAPQENADELYSKGCEYHNRNEYGQAMPLFRQAAEMGHARALNMVGFYYDTGKSVAQDYAKAVENYRKAAEKGHVVAAYNLALKYKEGQGVAQNYAEALKWFETAADEGDADAMNQAGILYHNGDGVAQNYVKAREYYLKAVDRGQINAMRNLGLLYENGLGVVKDLAEAAKWYKKAEDNGHKNVHADIERVNKELSKSQKKGFFGGLFGRK